MMIALIYFAAAAFAGGPPTVDFAAMKKEDLSESGWSEPMKDGETAYRIAQAGNREFYIKTWWDEKKFRPPEGTMYIIELTYKDTFKTPAWFRANGALSSYYYASNVHRFGGSGDSPVHPGPAGATRYQVGRGRTAAGRPGRAVGAAAATRDPSRAGSAGNPDPGAGAVWKLSEGLPWGSSLLRPPGPLFSGYSRVGSVILGNLVVPTGGKIHPRSAVAPHPGIPGAPAGGAGAVHFAVAPLSARSGCGQKYPAGDPRNAGAPTRNGQDGV